MFICTERWSRMRGIRPLNKLTAGDVHWMLCKQKQTSALCATNGEKHVKSALDLPFTANEVRTFRNYQLCLFQLKIGQVMWCMLKCTSNP